MMCMYTLLQRVHHPSLLLIFTAARRGSRWGPAQWHSTEVRTGVIRRGSGCHAMAAEPRRRSKGCFYCSEPWRQRCLCLKVHQTNHHQCSSKMRRRGQSLRDPAETLGPVLKDGGYVPLLLSKSSRSFSSGDRPTSPTAWVYNLDIMEMLVKVYGKLRGTSKREPQRVLCQNGME